MPLQPKPIYKHYVVEFMSFKDGEVYAKDYEFTDTQLITIQPDDLVRWMCLKVYGVADPAPDDNPTEGRSYSLEHYKKCISYYMPNRLMGWDAINNTGNPTKSIPVNELVKKIKKKEVQKWGKKSMARRGLVAAEFEQMLDLLEKTNNIRKKYMVSNASRFQYAMVARIDDTANFKAAELKPNPRFDFALLAQMCWSKNVMGKT